MQFKGQVASGGGVLLLNLKMISGGSEGFAFVCVVEA